MHRTLLAGLALLLFVAAPAEAGKKKKKKTEASAPPTSSMPVDADADAAPATGDDEMSIGRPAGMDFLELPCPYTKDSVHTWNLENERAEGKVTGTQVLTIVDVTPNSFTFDVGGEVTVETDDPVLKRLTEASNAFEVEPRVQFFTEAVSMNLVNGRELQPLYDTLVDEVEPMLKEAGMGEQEIANMRTMMTGLGMMENSITRNLYPLFNFTCGSFPTEAIDYQTQMPSPMGPPLPAKGRIQLERPGPDRVQFINTETVPMEAMVPALVAMSKGSMPEDEVRKALEAIEGEISTSVIVDVHVPTGAITSMESEQVVKVPGAEKRTRRVLNAAD